MLSPVPSSACTRTFVHFQHYINLFSVLPQEISSASRYQRGTTEDRVGGIYNFSPEAEMTKAAVIIDNGSGRCKTGIAGEDAPKSVFPAVIGKPKQKVGDGFFIPGKF